MCFSGANVLVEDQVIVERKIVGALGDVHVPQCRNDLRRGLIAKAIPFIPPYPASSALKRIMAVVPSGRVSFMAVGLPVETYTNPR